MKIRPNLKFSIALIFLLLSAIPLSISADLQVGVKNGDWIEYDVTTTGHLEDHDAQWARMEVANVLGPSINLNVTTQFTNGTYLIENVTLNLETGKLGDDFFIPANLSPGDTFYDARLGNITIAESESRTYAGAKREVLVGNTFDTAFRWDKQTGILVEAYSSYLVINFTIKTVTLRTNIWPRDSSTTTLEFYYVLASAFAVAAILAIVILRRRDKRKQVA